ncbi:MAG: PfkB family carbohydrate kinase, partial [bacterium]
TAAFCLNLARKAKQHGTKISFDLNYRASFWKGRQQELSQVFAEIAAVSDILIGNEEDFQLALGCHGATAGGTNLGDQIGAFKAMIDAVGHTYPNVKIFATTLREVVSANEHLWGAIVKDGDAWCVVEPRPIQVLDRIGGGDAFVGGLLYGLLKGWNAEKALYFGWASGALATTLLDDFALPADEEQVWGIWEGNARVRR